MTVKLVGIDLTAVAPLSDPIAPTRIRGVTILTEDAFATAAFVERFGYRMLLQDSPFTRMQSDTDAASLKALHADLDARVIDAGHELASGSGGGEGLDCDLTARLQGSRPSLGPPPT